MNYYIELFKPVIRNCKSETDYRKAYQRISSSIASLIIGRGFNEDFDKYLEKHPVKKEFYIWWQKIKYGLDKKGN